MVKRLPPDPEHIDLGPGWSPWKVSLFVIVFCGAMWGAVVWIGRLMFG